MNDREYHPHYPSTDNDLFERLCLHAHLFCNPFRLAFALYTPEQERQLKERYEASKVHK